jgi:hypothetical protein
MIQRSEEGKEVLDHMFLQTVMQGKKLNVGRIKATLTTFGKYVGAARKRLVGILKASKKNCARDIKATKGRFHDMTLRTVAVKRELDSTERTMKRTAVGLKRASQAARQYIKFGAMISQNAAAWKKFWSVGSRAIDRIEGLLSTLSNEIAHWAPSFIELPQSTNNVLTEINSELENSFDDLQGMRPIIENLVEIARKPKNLRIKMVRQKLVRMMHLVMERFHDFSNLMEEENEHQEGIFTGLRTLFGDATKTATRLVSTLQATQKMASTKAAWLRKGVAGSQAVAMEARHIVDLIMGQCRAFHQEIQASRVRFAKFAQIVGQLQEVVADRWGSLHGFFLQRFDQIDDKESEQ